VVIAKEPHEYEAWLTEQEEQARMAKAEEQRLLDMSMSKDELMALGERIYMGSCAACHQPNGQGIPGVFPSLKGTKMVLNDLPGHIDIVVNGKAGTAMQAFGKQLSLRELAAVVTYERNAWGNNTGDLIQAADINAHMNK
jgi:cytochrome c oxidase subunit II